MHAQLCEVLVHTKELLAPLEAKGVRVPRDDQWQVVRELYVQTRRQLQALAAVRLGARPTAPTVAPARQATTSVFELDGLE